MFTITKISETFILVSGTSSPAPVLMETVKDASGALLGQIVGLDGAVIKIQLYTQPFDLKIGDSVFLTGHLPLLEVGPGIMGKIFDPLEKSPEKKGLNEKNASVSPGLNYDKVWDFIPTVQIGEEIGKGSKIGYVQETPSIKHWIIYSKVDSAVIIKIEPGEYKILDSVCQIKLASGSFEEITMITTIPIGAAIVKSGEQRTQKVFDTRQILLNTKIPILIGSAVTISKAAEGVKNPALEMVRGSGADVVIFICFVKSGVEYAQISSELSELEGEAEKSNQILEKTIFVLADTLSSSSICAAKVSAGVSLAEYYRDMGCNVLLVIDSILDFASSIVQGPNYSNSSPTLAAQIANLYEKAGIFKTLSGDTASITIFSTIGKTDWDFAEEVLFHSSKCSSYPLVSEYEGEDLEPGSD